MNAVAWMSTLSLHASCEPTVKQPALSSHPSPMTVEQWDGTKFVERVMVWDGEKYREPWEIAMAKAEALDTTELTSCRQCGRDLNEDAKGDLCKPCWIWDGQFDAADDRYEDSVCE